MMTAEEERIARIKVQRNLMWLGIISIFMLFAGLTSAYVVAMGKPGFVPVRIPSMFWISAVIIAMSSISMFYAVRSAKMDSSSGITLGVSITFILGIVFTCTQFSGWGQLVEEKIFFTAHPSGQYLYMLSGLHLLHLAGGLISLIVAFFKSLKKRYSSSQSIGLEVVSMYWHFLGFLWIYLLLFLQLVR